MLIYFIDHFIIIINYLINQHLHKNIQLKKKIMNNRDIYNNKLKLFRIVVEALKIVSFC